MVSDDADDASFAIPPNECWVSAGVDPAVARSSEQAAWPPLPPPPPRPGLRSPHTLSSAAARRGGRRAGGERVVGGPPRCCACRCWRTTQTCSHQTSSTAGPLGMCRWPASWGASSTGGAPHQHSTAALCWARRGGGGGGAPRQGWDTSRHPREAGQEGSAAVRSGAIQLSMWLPAEHDAQAADYDCPSLAPRPAPRCAGSGPTSTARWPTAPARRRLIERWWITKYCPLTCCRSSRELPRLAWTARPGWGGGHSCEGVGGRQVCSLSSPTPGGCRAHPFSSQPGRRAPRSEGQQPCAPLRHSKQQASSSVEGGGLRAQSVGARRRSLYHDIASSGSQGRAACACPLAWHLSYAPCILYSCKPATACKARVSPVHRPCGPPAAVTLRP